MGASEPGLLWSSCPTRMGLGCVGFSNLPFVPCSQVKTQAGLILEHTECNDECSPYLVLVCLFFESIACLAGVSSFLDWLTALTKVAHHDRDRIQPSISDYMRVPWRGWGEPGGVSLSRARTLESFVIDLWFSSAYCFLCVFGPTPSG